MTPSYLRRWPEFEGKVIVVTGGSAGIGRGVVRAFAENGAKVVVAGRRKDAAERIAEAAGSNSERKPSQFPSMRVSPPNAKN